MLVIAVVGIKLTARTQIGMASVEYLIIVGFSVWGLVAVLGHHPGTFPVTRGWFSLSGIGGTGSLAAALLISVYVYSLWDGTLYVNEEVKHRRENPGRAAVFAVALLAVLYTFAQVGLQGVVSPARLQANASTAMVYVATALGGTGWAKLMALSIALSVTAATGTGIVLTARITYGMASYRTLPPLLGRVSPRHKTPAVASVAAPASPPVPARRHVVVCQVCSRQNPSPDSRASRGRITTWAGTPGARPAGGGRPCAPAGGPAR